MKLEISKAEVATLQQALNDHEAAPTLNEQLKQMFIMLLGAIAGRESKETETKAAFNKADEICRSRRTQNTSLRARLLELSNHAAEHDLSVDAPVTENAPTTAA